MNNQVCLLCVALRHFLDFDYITVHYNGLRGQREFAASGATGIAASVSVCRGAETLAAAERDGGRCPASTQVLDPAAVGNSDSDSAGKPARLPERLEGKESADGHQLLHRLTRRR